MKWFFGINEASTAFDEYAAMIKVAVRTAGERTSLKPHCLYDGSPNQMTLWMESNGVRVLPVKSRFGGLLKEEAARKGNPEIERTGSGAFLRVEIVSLPDLGDRERVVYTDCDVMFEADPVEYLRSSPCDLFSVAPESDANNYLYMNSGVMLMNIGRLRNSFKAFTKFIEDQLSSLVTQAWDQTAYNLFYAGQWNRLPLEMNWKPYWGENDNAVVIHFHGPKPTKIKDFEDGLKFVRPELVNEGYFRFAKKWSGILASI